MINVQLCINDHMNTVFLLTVYNYILVPVISGGYIHILHTSHQAKIS